MAERTVIAPGEIVPRANWGQVPYSKRGEGALSLRSLVNPRKKGLVLINSVGVIDGDIMATGNEGHIFAQMKKYHRSGSMFLKLGNVLFRLSLLLS